MRASWVLALHQFRLVLKSRGTLLTMFVLPLVMSLIFGVVNREGAGTEQPSYPVAVVNQDGSPASERLVEALRGEPSLEVRLSTAAELAKIFADREAVAALVIPAEYGNRLDEGGEPELQLVTPPEKGMHLVAVRPVLERVAARAAAGRGEAAVAVRKTPLTKEKTETAGAAMGGSQSSLGFTVMFIMLVVLQLGGAILQERKDGTWGRLLTTPTRRWALLTGYLVSFLAAGLFQFGVLVGLSALLFGVRWGPPLPLLAVALALVFASSGVGLFLATVVRTAEQQRVVATLLVIASSMLGGVFWPLEIVGETMQQVGRFTLQAWAIDGFREVMTRGGAWEGLGLPLLVLFGTGLLFLAGGMARVRYE